MDENWIIVQKTIYRKEVMRMRKLLKLKAIPIGIAIGFLLGLKIAEVPVHSFEMIIIQNLCIIIGFQIETIMGKK